MQGQSFVLSILYLPLKQSFYEKRAKSLEKFFLQLWKPDFDDFLQIAESILMYMNKRSVTRLKQLTGLIFCIVLAAGSVSRNLEKLAKCLYPCPDMRHS